MNNDFETGFLKTAAPSGVFKYWDKGTGFANSIAKKRTAHAASRRAQKTAIKGSYGGTTQQAGSVRLAPKHKPKNVATDRYESAQGNVSAIFGKPKKIKN